MTVVFQSGRQELELPSMEGTLERKHKLQLGGKKVNITIIDIFLTPTTTNKHFVSHASCFYLLATVVDVKLGCILVGLYATDKINVLFQAPCRAWNSYHAVLYKQTLCFYQDKKDTLKVSLKTSCSGFATK